MEIYLSNHVIRKKKKILQHESNLYHLTQVIGFPSVKQVKISYQIVT